MRNKLRQFKAVLGNHSTTYMLAGIALMAATGFQLAFPYVLRHAIDAVALRSALSNHLLAVGLGLLVIAGGEAGFTYLKGRLSAKAAEGTVKELRIRIYRHLVEVPFTAHRDYHTGDVIQRATSDVQTLGRFLSTQIVEVARTVCLLLGVSAIMLHLDFTLALYALAVIPVIFLFSFLFVGKIQRQFESYDEAEAELSSKLQEYLTGIQVVKAFAREEYEHGAVQKINRKVLEEDLKLTKLHSVFWPTSDLLCMLQVFIILVVGGLRAVAGDISIGTFVAFNTYILYLIWPVRHVGRLLGELGRASVSLKRINEILAQPVEDLQKGNAKLKGGFKGEIEYRSVTFGYKDLEILHNVSFTLPAGQTVAILGPTGSGKTTLIQLLARFYDEYQGAILLDGKDIRELPKAKVRSYVGMVLQEPFLFSRTLQQNISYGDREAKERKVKRAAVVADIDATIAKLSDRYQTKIGERGVTLSGGQKQRVALARTLLPNTPILILDDTTSALDTETEARILAAIRKKFARKTTLIVTHRVSTAAEADLILVLEQGRVSQFGTHRELLRRPGYYQNLVRDYRQRHAKLKEELSHARGTIQRGKVQKQNRYSIVG